MPESADPLACLGSTRDALLECIVEALSADARVVAAWLSGSFGRGEADAWSDLDLHIAVADAHLDAFLVERTQLYSRVGRPILVQNEMRSDSQPGAWFQLVLFDGPVEVDWNIGPLSRAVRPAASRALFDRAGVPLMSSPSLTAAERRERAADRLVFFWAMAPIAVKYAGRGETRRVCGQIALMTNAYISLWRLLHEPEGPEPYLPAANRPLEPAIDAHLPVLGERIDPLAALDVIRALCAGAQSLHPAFAALGVPLPEDVPAQVSRMSVTAERVLRRGSLPRRRFR